MPVDSLYSYTPPFYLRNGHLATLYPSIFRKIKEGSYRRERISTSDDDFLDIDWFLSCKGGTDRLIVVSHGLEGNSSRHYVKGTALYFQKRGWDALVWNCRGCSGEINLKPRFYHHAATEDLEDVIHHVNKGLNYKEIWLVGYSMGGSLSLKYLGEGKILPANVKGAVAFSVPCDLASSVEELGKWQNSFYRKRFLKKLGKKIKAKAVVFPDVLSYEGFESIRYFPEFDNRYTAPLHGFKDAYDFYDKGSPNRYIPGIEKPTLIVNAADDPFLPEECYPYDLVRGNPYVSMEVPRFGGHVGFLLAGSRESWAERRAWEFVQQYQKG